MIGGILKMESLENLTMLRVYTVRDAPEAEPRTVYADQNLQLIAGISKEGVSYDTFTVNHLPPEADIPTSIGLSPSELPKPGHAFMVPKPVEVVNYTVVPADAVDALVALYLGGVEAHATRKGVIDEKERRYQAEIAELRRGLGQPQDIPELLRVYSEFQGEAHSKSLDQLTKEAAALYLTDRVTISLGAGPEISKPTLDETPVTQLANVLDVYRSNDLLRAVVGFSGEDLTLFKSRSGKDYTMNKQGGVMITTNPGVFRSVFQSSEIAEDMLKDNLTTSREAARHMENQVRNYLNGLIQGVAR